MEQRPVRRVVERADHPRDVSQRRALEAALAQRPRGLALEIDDHEVAAGVQHLARVEVAVDADALAAEAVAQERPQASVHGAMTREDHLRVVGGAGRQALGDPSEQPQVVARQRVDRLVDGALVVLGERLGCERRIARLRRQRGVQLPGPDAELARQVKVRADGAVGSAAAPRSRRRGVLPQSGTRRAAADPLDHPLEVVAERVERVGEHVALVGDELLGDRGDAPRAVGSVVLERAADRGDRAEAACGQEPPDLEIRVDAVLDAR